MILPDDPMAFLAAAHDVLLTRIVVSDRDDRRPAFYICEGGDCGCIFWPDNDEDVIYPDRFLMSGGECEADFEAVECGCHRFPRSLQTRSPRGT